MHEHTFSRDDISGSSIDFSCIMKFCVYYSNAHSVSHHKVKYKISIQ